MYRRHQGTFRSFRAETRVFSRVPRLCRRSKRDTPVRAEGLALLADDASGGRRWGATLGRPAGLELLGARERAREVVRCAGGEARLKVAASDARRERRTLEELSVHATGRAGAGSGVAGVSRGRRRRRGSRARVLGRVVLGRRRRRRGLLEATLRLVLIGRQVLTGRGRPAGHRRERSERYRETHPRNRSDVHTPNCCNGNTKNPRSKCPDKPEVLAVCLGQGRTGGVVGQGAREGTSASAILCLARRQSSAT